MPRNIAELVGASDATLFSMYKLCTSHCIMCDKAQELWQESYFCDKCERTYVCARSEWLTSSTGVESNDGPIIIGTCSFEVLCNLSTYSSIVHDHNYGEHRITTEWNDDEYYVRANAFNCINGETVKVSYKNEILCDTVTVNNSMFRREDVYANHRIVADDGVIKLVDRMHDNLDKYDSICQFDLCVYADCRTHNVRDLTIITRGNAHGFCIIKKTIVAQNV